MLLLPAVEARKMTAVGCLLVSYTEIETCGRAYVLNHPWCCFVNLECFLRNWCFGELSLEAFRNGEGSDRIPAEGMTGNVCLTEASFLFTPLLPGHCPEGRTQKNQKTKTLGS